MKKIVLTFGTIAGLICGSMFFLMSPAEGESMDFEYGHIYGYISMIIALSTIFFAVKRYRDNFGNGHIKFGKAFLIGLYITLVAGVIYVVAWEIHMLTSDVDFVEQYLEYQKTKLAEDGKSEAEISTEVAKLEGMMDSYKNNRLVRMGMSFMEIFPVGVLVSLISALVFGVFLKREKVLT